MTIAFTSLTPANNSTYSVARLPIVFQISSDESNVPVIVEYWMSTSASPQTDPAAYYNSQAYTIQSGGFTSNSILNLELPTGVTLTPGSWTIHARLKYNPSGNVIDTKTQSFSIVFTPAATPLSPYSNETRPFVNTTSNLLLTWAFAGDAQNSDLQTAYQVLVNRVSDNALVLDTGKVTSSVTQAVVTIPQAYADVQLSWRVRVWNKWNTPSNYTTSSIFTLGSAFSLTITSPTNGEGVSAGNPNLTASVSISGGRTVQTINASAWKGDVKVWEKSMSGNWANGATVNITDSVSVFTSTSYTYRVVGQDNTGSWSTPATRNFSVSYSLPPTPSGGPTLVVTNYSTNGYISVLFNDSSRDTDFYCWAIERRDDLIHPTTGVTMLTGDWTEIGRVYGVASTYHFDDYLAPSNHKVTYRVVQVAVKYGSEVRSVASSNSATVVPVTDSYWLYAGPNGDPAGIGIRLHNVVSDSFSTEDERSEFILMSRGRYSEKGTRLGVIGTLTCQLRDTDGTPARMKRLLLEDFTDVFPVARLRNPFGDLYLVSLGDLGVERIPGTGASEFTNVTIPYSEVVS